MAHDHRSGSPSAKFLADLKRRATVDRLMLEARGLGNIELSYTSDESGRPVISARSAREVLDATSRGGKGSGSVGKGKRPSSPKGSPVGPRKPGPIRPGTTKGKGKRMTKGQAQRIVAGL